MQTLITIQVELGVAGVVSVVLPVLFDKGSWQVLVLGVLFSAGEWMLALWLAKKI